MKKLLRVLNPSEHRESNVDTAKTTIRTFLAIKDWKKESFKNELTQVDILFDPKKASVDELGTAIETVKKSESTFHKPFLLFDMCKVVLGNAQELLGKKKEDRKLATSLQALPDKMAIAVQDGEGWEDAALQSAIARESFSKASEQKAFSQALQKHLAAMI